VYHYPLLAPVLSAVAGPEVTLVDSAEETALALEALVPTGILRRVEPGPTHRYVVSDDRSASPRWRAGS
jgi:glutamate racemase